MKSFYFPLFFLSIMTLFSCNKDDDVNPIQQQVVTNDTSSTSGELTVEVKYSQNGSILSANQNANVRLYATYEDLKNDLYIYDLYTSDKGIAYFGFINIGTYYVFSEYTAGEKTYQKESAVQIRSQRNENLTITLENNF